MGSRRSWIGCCLGCSGLWVAAAIAVVLLGRMVFQHTSVETDLEVFLLFGLVPAAIPAVIGVILLLVERAEQAPQRERQFVDDVYTMIVAEDGATVEEIARRLGCRTKRVRAALQELIDARRLVGYRETGTDRYHAVDPGVMRSGDCPCCGEPLDEPGRRGRCAACGCEIYPPRGAGARYGGSERD